ncbi:hypothetical protein BaRGS_00008242 [Batillaria attramentaria]|uniref:Uncharacterized protein n=1 Tax=Batillaria attramentaria TaxID=370345 RepID=A0ABD0LNN4_9CAEN
MTSLFCLTQTGGNYVNYPTPETKRQNSERFQADWLVEAGTSGKGWHFITLLALNAFQTETQQQQVRGVPDLVESSYKTLRTSQPKPTVVLHG